MKTIDADAILARATPAAHQEGHEIQPFNHVVKMPIALPHETCVESVGNVNQAGPTFYPLHLLFDKHYDEQNNLVDAIAERIQVLGGVSVAMTPDVHEVTLIPRPTTRVISARRARLSHRNVLLGPSHTKRRGR
jgi:hypothetical protein